MTRELFAKKRPYDPNFAIGALSTSLLDMAGEPEPAGFYVHTVAGHTVHIKGDPGRNPDALATLMTMMDRAIEQYTGNALAPVAIFSCDEQGRITANGKAYEFLSTGTTPEGIRRGDHFAQWLNEMIGHQTAKEGNP